MVTVEKKLIAYLEALTMGTGKNHITSSQIEKSIPIWVEQRYGDTHNGSTFGRAWRKLREKHDINIKGTIKIHDDEPYLNIHVKLDNKPNSREHRWMINRM